MGHKPVVGLSSSLAVPLAIHPRIDQSLDTTMEDASLKPSSNTIPPRTITAPEPYERDPYEWDAAQGDNDDYNNTDSEDFACKEDLQQTHVMNKAAREKKAPAPLEVSYDTSTAIHGSWSGAPINTVKDWESIYDATTGGNDYAMGYIASLNAKH
jgi:hypothetical protein